MWIVKIGGSLCADPLLPQWLDLLTQLGGGRVTVVCGGGAYADEVRRAQARWRFDDLAAHNMALLAMAQGAYMLQALSPALRLVRDDDDIRRVLRLGQAAVWSPLEQLREQADVDTNWEVTADSIALALARRMNAERLLLVKSCTVDGALTLPELGAAGVVDRRFAVAARGAAFPIEIVNRSDMPRVRELLLNGSGPLADQGLRLRR
jgi:aspartokinase-like uncharacterized kinase